MSCTGAGLSNSYVTLRVYQRQRGRTSILQEDPVIWLSIRVHVYIVL